MIKVNNEIIDFKRFNDGTTRVEISIPSTQIAYVTWLYDNNEEILSLYYLISHLKEHHKQIHLKAPFWPNGRQDRVKSNKDVFTLKYCCNLFNSLNIEKIEIFDIHSFVTPALLNNVVVQSPDSLIQNILDNDKNLLLAYCDEGGFKRYYDKFTQPYVFGCKIRNYETQKIESMQILGNTHVIAGRDILIIDDIISRGSTTNMMISQLKEYGAKDIYIYASHVEQTIFNYHLLDRVELKKIYTTNSIYRSTHPKIEIVHTF